MTVEALLNQIRIDGFRLMPIKNTHSMAYNYIPLFPDHKDPFDRLILATALSERLPVISADENFRLYVSQIHLIEN